MKKLLRIKVFLLIFLFAVFLSESMATGVGFNISGGRGEAEWNATNWSHSGSDKDFDFDTDIKKKGAGFVLDTAVSSDRVFNYRLNLGWERNEYKIDDVYKYIIHPDIYGKFETSGWFMSHDFGFRIFNNSKVRIWMGPQVRLSSTKGELKSNKNYEIDFISFGVGPVLGLNIHITSSMSILFKAGMLFERNWGELENRSNHDDWKIDSEGEYSFASAGLLFRFGESY